MIVRKEKTKITVKDIQKLFWHDCIYILRLVECEGGECIPKYTDEYFTEEDFSKEVRFLDVRDETVDINHPQIIVDCYTFLD